LRRSPEARVPLDRVPLDRPAAPNASAAVGSFTCAVALAVASSLFACSAPAPSEGASPFAQTAFRIRTDPAASLNVDAGWAAPEGAEGSVLADRPFRVRFEVEGAPAPGARFGLQARRNAGPWEDVLARDFPYPDEISTPRVSVVSTTAWNAGDATQDVLSGSNRPFAPGSGVALDSMSAAWSTASAEAEVAHGEWEWPLVIRRFADGAVANEPGDVFELRMVDAEGRPVLPSQGGPVARVVLEVPDRLLGGTYVETPGVLGPWQTTRGDLYFPLEPAETDNVLMMVRSVDGGRTWAELDGENRPATDDLEGFATAFHDGRVYMLHQISEATYLHAFRTSDVAAAPDSWEVRDELVATHSKPPTQVAALVARTDGSLVAVYGDSVGLRLRVRAPEGGWSDERRVEAPAGLVASGVMAVRGQGNVVHLAYTAGDGARRSAWLTTFLPDGTFGEASRLADGIGPAEEEGGALAPLAHLEEDGSVVVLYRLADGSLHERRVATDGSLSAPVRVTERRVVQNGSDSDQVGADAVVHDGTVHVLFIDEETRDLWHTSSAAAGVWTPARPVVEGINAQWIRGAVLRGSAGAPVYGFVYDAGSDGGSGMNHYDEVRLSGAGG